MPPVKHALLGASSAARWIDCPPSARATEHLPDSPSKYAEEGTKAHAVCEKALRHNLPEWEQGRPVDSILEWSDTTPEMLKAANLYLDFIHEQWALFPHKPSVFIEQEVDVSRWVPGGFGTCNCLLIGDGILHIIDFKYGQGEFSTGPHCRFCKAYPSCRAWQEKYGPLADFKPYADPATLSDEELADWLQKVQGLAAYAKDLEEYAQQALLEGRTLPGWKLVQGRSTRKWTDQDAAFRQMEADGIDEAMLYTRTPITLTLAEKMIGKKKFAETMSAFITKAPGAPKLAAASDPHPAYDRLEGFKPEED